MRPGVLDAVIEAVRAVLPDDPVAQAVRGIVSPEQISLGEPVRAATRSSWRDSSTPPSAPTRP
jgi:hypothetical protein